MPWHFTYVLMNGEEERSESKHKTIEERMENLPKITKRGSAQQIALNSALSNKNMAPQFRFTKAIKKSIYKENKIPLQTIERPKFNIQISSLKSLKKTGIVYPLYGEWGTKDSEGRQTNGHSQIKKLLRIVSLIELTL